MREKCTKETSRRKTPRRKTHGERKKTLVAKVSFTKGKKTDLS